MTKSFENLAGGPCLKDTQDPVKSAKVNIGVKFVEKIMGRVQERVKAEEEKELIEKLGENLYREYLTLMK